MEVIRPKIGIGKNHYGMKKCDFCMTEKFKYEMFFKRKRC